MRWRTCLCHFVADLVKANWTCRGNHVRKSDPPFHLMRIFHEHFLFFHMKPGTHCALHCALHRALHRARAQLVENMAWMIRIIILMTAGLTFIEHFKPSRCKIHTSASWHSSLLMTQLFSAQCCHPESISVTPQPGCCFLSQKRSSALKNKQSSFQKISRNCSWWKGFCTERGKEP